VLNKKIGKKQMPKKTYKVKMDISMALPDLKKLGITETKKHFWIHVEAIDPDDACAEAYDKVYILITSKSKSKKFKDAAEVVKEKLRILKIEIE